MYLKQLKLTNFKNLAHLSLDLSPEINALVGANGLGKTNVLDAVHCLCVGKSYLNFKDTQNIKTGEDFFRIDGRFYESEVEEEISCLVQNEQKKVLQRNGKTYARISDHVGQFPCVFISPYDSNLISEGSDRRRKFLDAVISQSNKGYLKDLMQYNKLVSQRNALLKYFAQNRTFQVDQLEVYDYQLLPLNERIGAERKAFLADFARPFADFYAKISGNQEKVGILYRTQSDADGWLEGIQANRQKDKLAQYTTVGIHKDDLRFELNGNPIRTFGSQGQQKTFLIALKLAQLKVMRERLERNPILLLDDIFDKLDENRVHFLLQLVREEAFGQIILSDTHPERTQELITKIDPESKLITW